MRRRWVWFLLGAALLVWAGASVYLWVRPRFNYEPIGDPLFDRTALWVLEQHAEMPSEPTFFREWLYLNTDFYELPECTVDFSEPFSWGDWSGNDPRYRQLIWQIGLVGKLLDADYVVGHTAAPQWERREELLMEGGSPGDYALLWWSTGSIPEVSYEQELEEGEREIAHLRELADQAIALDPENSYFYYIKADLESSLGEFEAAWDLVKKGNAAPHNYVPLAFPESVLADSSDRFRTRDSKRAAALIWLAIADRRDRQFSMTRQRYIELLLALALGFPLEAADDYYVRGRRMVEMENQPLLSQLHALALCRALVDYIVQEGIVDLDARREEEARLIMLYTQSAVDEVMEYSASVSFYSRPTEYSSPVYPLPGVRVEPGVWDLIVDDMKRTAQLRLEADILDPPPFAIWARGELVGLDTSGVAQSGEDGAEAPGA